jgi:virulence factor Mce-like protein
MRSRRGGTSDLFSNPILVGSMILAIGLIGIVLSYRANKGLPFVPAYEIRVQVPDAAELIVGGSEVRVGGARVGLVTDVQAMPGQDGKPTYAELTLALEKDQEPIALDSFVKVRPRSILGAKYLDLEPGKSAQGVPAGGTLPLSQGRPIVELDEAFNVFDDETSRGLQSTITSLGDAFAGRGQDMNDGIVATRRLLPPAQRVLTTVIAPQTELGRLVRGTASAFGALAPVSPRLVRLLDDGAVTLRALDASAPALADTIQELPRTEIEATAGLVKIRPVLADAASIARAIRPGTAVLPLASGRLRDALRAGTPVLRRTPAFADGLETTLATLGTVARDPNAPASVQKLITTVTTLKTTLDTLLPAQVQCNLLPVAFRNAYSAVSVGDTAGPWFSQMQILNSTQDQQSKAPSANLHVTPVPNANASECEAGNESYAPGQQIGNPSGLQRNSTAVTTPPTGVPALAAKAGLVGTTR